MMPSWNRAETIELIRGRVDKTQRGLVKDSLISLESRRDYAYFHFKEASRLYKALVISNQGRNRLRPNLQKEGQKQEQAFQRNLIKIHAHTTACLQNLHSISDTLAYAIYLSLERNLLPKGLKLKEITLAKVAEEFNTHPELTVFAAILKGLSTDENHEYLNALVNHGKHRSLVRQVFWTDLTGNKAETYDLKFESFEYKGIHHCSRSTLPFMQVAIDHLSELIVITGEHMNTYLRCLRM